MGKGIHKEYEPTVALNETNKIIWILDFLGFSMYWKRFKFKTLNSDFRYFIFPAIDSSCNFNFLKVNLFKMEIL